MDRQANVQSIAALHRFRAALDVYQARVHDAWIALTMETRRAVDWVDHDRSAYWLTEMRSAAEALAEAANLLERKQMTTKTADRPACAEEKETVHRARQRWQHAEDRLRAVEHWRRVVQHQADEFRGVIAKLAHLVETDLPKATAALDRMVEALERYAQPSISRPEIVPTAPRSEPPRNDQ